jgi:hypothetical protein
MESVDPHRTHPWVNVFVDEELFIRSLGQDYPPAGYINEVLQNNTNEKLVCICGTSQKGECHV